MVSAHVLATSCVFCDKNYYLKKEKNNSWDCWRSDLILSVKFCNQIFIRLDVLPSLVARSADCGDLNIVKFSTSVLWRWCLFFCFFAFHRWFYISWCLTMLCKGEMTSVSCIVCERWMETVLGQNSGVSIQRGSLKNLVMFRFIIVWEITGFISRLPLTFPSVPSYLNEIFSFDFVLHRLDGVTAECFT